MSTLDFCVRAAFVATLLVTLLFLHKRYVFFSVKEAEQKSMNESSWAERERVRLKEERQAQRDLQ